MTASVTIHANSTAYVGAKAGSGAAQFGGDGQVSAASSRRPATAATFLMAPRRRPFADRRAHRRRPGAIAGRQHLLEQAALDKYAFLRDSYLQRRHYQIHDGNPPRREGACRRRPVACQHRLFYVMKR